MWFSITCRSEYPDARTKEHLPEARRNDMRIALAFTSLLVIVCATDARAQSTAQAASCNLPHASGVSPQQITSGQRQRAYRLFIPSAYDGHVRLPLVLDLHGSGGSSTGQARTSGFETLAASERFLVATLDAEGARWNVPVQDGRADDVAYVTDVIAHVATLTCLDDTRVYATGFSGGARMTSLLGCTARASPRLRRCPGCDSPNNVRPRAGPCPC
jgi:polyhydroxybutyrate depolymerase